MCMNLGFYLHLPILLGTLNLDCLVHFKANYLKLNDSFVRIFYVFYEIVERRKNCDSFVLFAAKTF